MPRKEEKKEEKQITCWYIGVSPVDLPEFPFSNFTP